MKPRALTMLVWPLPLAHERKKRSVIRRIPQPVLWLMTLACRSYNMPCSTEHTEHLRGGRVTLVSLYFVLGCRQTYMQTWRPYGQQARHMQPQSAQQQRPVLRWPRRARGWGSRLASWLHAALRLLGCWSSCRVQMRAFRCGAHNLGFVGHQWCDAICSLLQRLTCLLLCALYGCFSVHTTSRSAPKHNERVFVVWMKMHKGGEPLKPALRAYHAQAQPTVLLLCSFDAYHQCAQGTALP